MHSIEDDDTNPSAPFAYSLRGKPKARKRSPLGPGLIENGMSRVISRRRIENCTNIVNAVDHESVKAQMSDGLVQDGISGEGSIEAHFIRGLVRKGINGEESNGVTHESARNFTRLPSTCFSHGLLECDHGYETDENAMKLVGKDELVENGMGGEDSIKNGIGLTRNGAGHGFAIKCTRFAQISFNHGLLGYNHSHISDNNDTKSVGNDSCHGSVENRISDALMQKGTILAENNGVHHGSVVNDLNLELFGDGIRSARTDLCENVSEDGIYFESDENDIRLMKDIGASPGSVKSDISYQSAEDSFRFSENGMNPRAREGRCLDDSVNGHRVKSLRCRFLRGTHALQVVSQVKDVGDLLKCDEDHLPGADLSNYDDEILPLENFKSRKNTQFDGDFGEISSDNHMENELNLIGNRVATAGWYVCDQGTILLAHENGSCSIYDSVNMECKAEYRCPEGAAQIPWDDCWLVRAVGSDGYTSTYIVAATSGSALDTGFCSWDFDARSVAAYHWDSENQSNGVSQRKWYKPCGALIASAGTASKSLTLHDIRDGDTLMTWALKGHISSLDFSSPLQWMRKDKLVLAENYRALSLWDVNAMGGQPLRYIALPEESRICALHIHDVDDDCSTGIRRRLNSSETEGYDGILCTEKDINVIDFRVPGGIGQCFSSLGEDLQSVYARGDAILTGGVHPTYNECGMQQWSARNGRLVCTYAFQPSSSSSHYAQLSLAQVWGSCNAVMAVNGNGLHIYKGLGESSQMQCCITEKVEGVLGTQDLFNPSFDYAHSRVLLISRDRPATWCYWTQ